jgi:cardiolipin synthase
MMKSLRLASTALVLAGLLTGCGQASSPMRPAMEKASAANLVAKGRSPVATDGNMVKLLIDGPAIFDSMVEAISKAERSVQIHAYQLGGETGMRLVNAMVERHKAGVECQVLIDPNLGGTPSIRKQIDQVLAILKANGIEHRLFNLKGMPKGPNWLSRLGLLDHSKTLVVDGKVAFAGGMNFYDDGAHNHDYMVRIEGPAATRLGEMSNADWVHSGGQDGTIKLEMAEPKGYSKIELAENSPSASNIRSLLLRHFHQAKTKIWIEVLFLDDDMIIDALVDAKQRGVDVRVILDPLDFGNHVKELEKVPFDGIPNWAAVQDCLEAQIPVYWFTPQKEHQNLHAKISNVDDRFLLIGSANYTYRALDRNRETTLAVEAPYEAYKFSQTFLADEADARRITSLSAFQRALAALFDRVKRGIYNAKTDAPAPAPQPNPAPQPAMARK